MMAPKPSPVQCLSSAHVRTCDRRDRNGHGRHPDDHTRKSRRRRHRRRITVPAGL